MKANGREIPAGGIRARGSALRILIVDDYPNTAEELAILVRSQGHCPLIAHTGTEAVALARQFPPDVALLEIDLPGMDGCEVAKFLHTLSHKRRPLLIAITGYGQVAERERSRNAGIDLHLVKPIESKELFQLLDRFEGILHPPIIAAKSEGTSGSQRLRRLSRVR